MSYRVLWLGDARRDLARYWAQADGDLRAAITKACAAIDEILQDDPENVGESRAADRRVLNEPPVTVFFEVHDEEMAVVVLEARVYRRRGG